MLAKEYGIRHTTLQPTWPVGHAAKDRRVIPVRAAEEPPHAH